MLRKVLDDAILRNKIFHLLNDLHVTSATLVIGGESIEFVNLQDNNKFTLVDERFPFKVPYTYQAYNNDNNCPVCSKPIVFTVQENKGNDIMSDFECAGCGFKGVQFSSVYNYGYISFNPGETVESYKEKYNDD
jgi:hypothetical protein